MRTIGRARGASRRVLVTLLAAALVLGAMSGAGLPRAAHADGAWLDDQSVTWNTAGMAIPAAPEKPAEVDPRCVRQARPAESDEDRAVEAAGWTLFSNYTAGWGIKIVSGLSSYDGMCRPLGFQAFVFVDGKLAGTLSPMPMNSRDDGALEPDLVLRTRVAHGHLRSLHRPGSALLPLRALDGYLQDRADAGRSGAGTRESTNTQPTSPAGP